MDTIHYNETIKLRDWFIFFSKIEAKHEAYKIWARWIITYQSLYTQSDQIIPTNEIEHDLQTVIELVSKGMTLEHAKKHYKTLCKLSLKLINSKPDDRLINVTVKDSNNYTCIIKPTCGKQYILTNDVYKALSKKYTQHKLPWKGMDGLLNSFVYSLIRRYDLLDGNSLQWAIPKRLFVFLNRNFKCNTEIFASPFNTYFKRYYSLFDEDKYFGSLGNFFNAPDDNFRSGCFEINPPFIEVLFDKVSTRAIYLLKTAEQNNEDLTFIYIIPAWTNLKGYDMVADNKYCKKIISMQKGCHYYQYNNNLVKAMFNSKMVILSSKHNICSDYAEKQIKICWSQSS